MKNQNSKAEPTSAGQTQGAKASSRRTRNRSSAADIATLRQQVQQAATGDVKYLFCVRESDQWDKALFDGMRQQTYSNHRGLRFVEPIYAAGMDPWAAASSGNPFTVTMQSQDGTPVDFRVEVTLMPGPYKTLLFRFGDTIHLWCMGSAAMLGRKTTIGLYNRQVAEVVRTSEPENLIVANITRLIRSLALFHWFMAHAVDVTSGPLTGDVRVRYIWNGNRRLDMEDTTDRRSLNELAANAEADYLGIIQRTVAGRLVSASRGNWALGASSQPWGYTFNRRLRTLELDESVRPQIAEMLAIMASERNITDKVYALAELGMPMKRKVKADGSPASIADSGSQLSAIYWATLRFLSVYTHGEFLFRHSNPGLRIDQLAGIPLVRQHAKDRGEFQMLLHAPLPKGGWVRPKLRDKVDEHIVRESNSLRARLELNIRDVHPDLLAASSAPHVLAAALPLGDFSRHDYMQRRGAGAHKLTSVLSGRRWRDEEMEYQMFSPTPELYEVRARILPLVDKEQA